MAQTYGDVEIVVSDNASTDDTVGVARTFTSRGVRLIRNPQNLGLAPNFDRVAEASRGRHLLLLSSDDLIYPHALERYAAVLDATEDRDLTVVISAYDQIDSVGEVQSAMHRPPGEVMYASLDRRHVHEADEDRPCDEDSGLGVLALALQHRLAPAPFVATCFPRALFDRVGGYRSGFRAWPDTHFALKLLSEDPLLVYVPERLFAYRVHDANQFTSFDRQGLLYYQMDSYLHTTEFPQEVLDRTDVSRRELVDAYVTRAILGRAHRAIVGGRPALALRYLAFGLATHPRAVARRPSALGVAAMAVTGPVGRAAAQRGWHGAR